MSWQDFVFLVGSMTSVLFLYPTLRNAAAQVPRATSIPSMIIGGVYSFTFFTLGMEFSAYGAFAACSMWSLIALFRGPDDTTLREEMSLSGVRARLRAVQRRVSTTDAEPSAPERVDDVVSQSD